ncbi:MAG: hypothetical protein HOH25_12910 [Opitutae bacterium]|jgi:hypothetical protein|nr:hypothetical protein [Opitutae bacterium]
MTKSFILILATGILTMGSFAFSLETERKAPSQLRKIDPRKFAGLKKPGIKKAPALARKAPDAGKLEAFGKSLKEAIAAGKLTEDEAKAKWDALTKGRGNKKPAEGKRDLGKGKKPPTDAKRPQVKRPAKLELSDETKAQLEAIKKDKDALKTAIGEELEKLGLGKDSSKDDVRAAVEAFREANKDRFDAIKEASEKVHETVKAARPKQNPRPERKKRPEPTPEIKAKIAAVKAVGKKLHESRGNLRKELKDASDENRKALIEKFKADNKDKHQELKAAHKELKETIRADKQIGETRTAE